MIAFVFFLEKDRLVEGLVTNQVTRGNIFGN